MTRTKARVFGGTFEVTSQIGAAINDRKIVTASGEGITVRGVHFEDCWFAHDVHSNTVFVDCTFTNCEFSDSNWPR